MTVIGSMGGQEQTFRAVPRPQFFQPSFVPFQSLDRKGAEQKKADSFSPACCNARHSCSIQLPENLRGESSSECVLASVGGNVAQRLQTAPLEKSNLYPRHSTFQPSSLFWRSQSLKRFLCFLPAFSPSPPNLNFYCYPLPSSSSLSQHFLTHLSIFVFPLHLTAN